jgi:hypothetical protein
MGWCHMLYGLSQIYVQRLAEEYVLGVQLFASSGLWPLKVVMADLGRDALLLLLFVIILNFRWMLGLFYAGKVTGELTP